MVANYSNDHPLGCNLISVLVLTSLIPITSFQLPYTAKLSSGKTFTVFMILHSIANIFPQILWNKLFYRFHARHNVSSSATMKVFPWMVICIPTTKVFPLKSFAVYGSLAAIWYQSLLLSFDFTLLGRTLFLQPGCFCLGSCIHYSTYCEN